MAKKFINVKNLFSDRNADTAKESFFTKDTSFYKTILSLIAVETLRNLLAYGATMTDNIMLGSYSQAALSGVATVNQIFFIVQEIALVIGNALIVLASQYWGKGEIKPIRTLTRFALIIGFVISCLIFMAVSLFPNKVLGLFTTSPEIISQGHDYLSLLKWSFVLYFLSNTLLSALKSIGNFNIAFAVSAVSLVVNVSINYILIFGKLGFPELGVRGAAVGTIVARTLELAIVVIYLAKGDKKLFLLSGERTKDSKNFAIAYRNVLIPILFGELLWAFSVPIQSAILGNLSADAIAANSISTTFFQCFKNIIIAISSTSAVIIGNDIGRGNMAKIRSDSRTLSVIGVSVGIILGLILFFLRYPILSMYKLSEPAMILADHLIIIMSIVMVGMAYQMPVSSGIIQGSGDGKFILKMNLISCWMIVIPLSILSAFVWKWPVEAVVLVIQSDQFFKGVPIFLRFKSYRWVHNLSQ